MINNKTSMGWLPEIKYKKVKDEKTGKEIEVVDEEATQKELQNFVSYTSPSDLRFIDQSINLLKFNKEQLLDLQTKIERDMIIREYFSHPPSIFVKQHVENYDNEDSIKREIEDKYQTQIKEIEDYKNNMLTSPRESKPQDFSVADLDGRIRNLKDQAVADYRKLLEYRKNDKPRIQKLFNEVNRRLK